MNFNEVLGDELAGQMQAKINEFNAAQTDADKRAKFVDLSEGGYVSRNKFDDKVNGLQSQINDLQGQIGQRDTDMTALQKQLEAASTDSSKLTEAQQALANLQNQYAQEKTDWENKINAQAYEFRIRELSNGLKFSSKAAKTEFVRDAIAKGFQIDNGKVLGFDDYVDSYRQADPEAFIAEEAPAAGEDKPKPEITLGAQGQNPTRSETGFGFHFQGVRPQK